MSGWYAMHRGWMDHPLFRNEPLDRRGAFVWLIENAAHRPCTITGPGGQIHLDRGQLSFSFRYLARAWRWDEAKVRRFCVGAQKSEIIDASTDAGQTVITIRNYEKYQARQTQPDAAIEGQPTQHRRSGDANKNNDNNYNNEQEEEGGARYAFFGRSIRLTAGDLDRWRATYHSIFDLNAELSAIDAWLQQQPEKKREGWFHSVQSMLNRKHQENLGAASQRARPEYDSEGFAIRRWSVGDDAW